MWLVIALLCSFSVGQRNGYQKTQQKGRSLPQNKMMRRTRVVWIFKLVDKAGSFYDTKNMTSKDIYNPLKTNQPYDPVANAYRMKEMLGPLKRKQHFSTDDYVNVDEAEKWMEVKHAAKLLGFKESELSTLSKEKLEERWAQLYREKTLSQQQEVVVAVEILLEYLDSNLFQKKNKAYYKNYVEQARSAIDFDLNAVREGWKHYMWHFTAVMMFGGSCVVIIAAVLQGTMQDKSDFEDIGKRAYEYMGIAMTQPRNLEPAPDYNTRYLTTPTSLDLDEQNGVVEKRLVDPRLALVMSQKEEFDKNEDALTIQLINNENERRMKENKERGLVESNVVIHRKEDYDENGEYNPQTSQVKAEDNAFQPMSLVQFMSLASQTFGGSKTQRYIGNVSDKAREAQDVKRRLKEVDYDKYRELYGDDE